MNSSIEKYKWNETITRLLTGLKDLKLIRWQYFPNWSIDSMKSLWMDNQIVVQSYNRILSSYKKGMKCW